ncbi:MAG: hypothetical protein C0171_06890 [Caldisphaera sp.]|jgi:hypothetical protein|uniref:hypothetical protein n=1 Tax=Caldisphaera sp. TaxID=2060322 RepID=UPI000CBD0625|nr:MAG: hypothetical protein C0171_06890 [Caldisphaera sp.]
MNKFSNNYKIAIILIIEALELITLPVIINLNVYYERAILLTYVAILLSTVIILSLTNENIFQQKDHNHRNKINIIFHKKYKNFIGLSNDSSSLAIMCQSYSIKINKSSYCEN